LKNKPNTSIVEYIVVMIMAGIGGLFGWSVGCLYALWSRIVVSVLLGLGLYFVYETQILSNYEGLPTFSWWFFVVVVFVIILIYSRLRRK
jgi:hypothetical protein